VQPLRSSNDEWIATEKVHGANFGVYLLNNGKTLRFAKRSNFMPESENFFGYHCIIPDLHRHALKAHQVLTELKGVNGAPLDTIIMNGELFGGKYHHANVARSKQSYEIRGVRRGVTAVQTEPFPQYTPDLHFYAFDLKYRIAPNGPLFTLTFDEATAVFEKVPGLLYQRALLRGPIDKILAFDVETFTTTVPMMLGMGKHYMRNNFAEGIIARHCRRGQPDMEGKTTMLKIKSSAFQELKADRTQVQNSTKKRDPMADARALAISRVGPQLPVVESIFLDANVAAACKHLTDHVCAQRLKNLISKLGLDGVASGSITQDSVAFLLAQDSLKDFIKDAAPEVINANLMQRREFARYVLFEAKRFVAKEWAQLLEQARAEAASATA
jgi:RNA-editing ligase